MLIPEQYILALFVFALTSVGSFFTWLAVQILRISKGMVRLECQILADTERRIQHDARIEALERLVFPPVAVLRPPPPLEHT